MSSARCNTFVKNIQSDSFEIRSAELSSFAEYLNVIIDEGSVPLETLGQGVCSNILFLLITKHVQPQLESKAGGGRTGGDKVLEVAKALYNLFDAIHSSLPFDYPLPPLLWKSSGALRKVIEHVLLVIESDILVSRCGVVYANLLLLLLRFTGYQNVVSRHELRRGAIRLTQILRQGLDPSLCTASANTLCSLLACPQAQQLSDDLPSVIISLCDLTAKYHESFDGSANQQLQSDMRLQAYLVKSVRILSQSSQLDAGMSVTSKANGLIKPLLSVWHRTSKRDEWRAETLIFLTVQLSFIFSQTLSGSQKQALDVFEPHPSNLILLHNDVVPLAVEFIFSNRRELEFDISGKLRAFPTSTAMKEFVEFGALLIYLANTTYTQYSSLCRQANLPELSIIVNVVLEQIGILSRNTQEGVRPAEIVGSVYSTLHFLSQPLTSITFSPTVATTLVEGLISCFPSNDAALNVGIMSALAPLWSKVPSSLLLSAFEIITPRLFCTQGSWSSSRTIPSQTCCLSLTNLLRSLRSKGVFLVNLASDYSLDKCAILNTNSDVEFKIYIADFFVEANAFSVSQPDSTIGTSVPLIPADMLARFLFLGLSGSCTTGMCVAVAARADFSATIPSKFEWSVSKSADAISTSNSPSNSLSTLFSFTSMGNFGAHLLQRYCALEGHRLRMLSLGRGATGSKVRHRFESFMAKEALLLLNPWSAKSPNLPKAVLEATAVHCTFTRALRDEAAGVSSSTFSIDSCSSSALLQLLSHLSMSQYESLEDEQEKQHQWESQQLETSRLRKFGEKERTQFLIVCMSSARICFCLRSMLQLYRAGAWSHSQDEDDLRVLLEKTCSSRKERRACHQQLTPQGGITFSVVLLYKGLESQLSRINLHTLFDGPPSQVAGQLDALDGFLSVIQLITEEFSHELCTPDLLLWDPQRGCLSALYSLAQWLSSLLKVLLTKAADDSVYALLLAPIRGSGSQASAGRGRSSGSSGSGLIGLAAASLLAGDSSVSYPILQLLVRVIERCCLSVRSLHLEVRSQSSSVFEKSLFNEGTIVNDIHAAYYMGGMLPNQSILNDSAASKAAAPFKGVQKPPIALLESLDSVALLLTSFGACSTLPDTAPAESIFALLHDTFYVVRLLYGESHIAPAIRIIEGICRDSCPLMQAEWGSEVLKELLNPREAVTRSIRFSASSVIAPKPDDDSPRVAFDLTIPPMRSDFALTDVHRVSICRAQATTMLKCQGKRWGVAVGRSLFSTCNGNGSFWVRYQAATCVSLPFKIYQRNLPVVFIELIEQVRDVGSYTEGSRCATSLLAVANSCAYAPSLEGDVVSFLLEVYATRSFEFKGMVQEALDYTHRHRDAAQKRSSEVAIAPSSDLTLPQGPGLAAGNIITQEHIFKVCFDWIWLHGHPLLSIPTTCFAVPSVENFIDKFISQVLPIAILTMHKLRTPSITTSATSGYLQPQQLGTTSAPVDSGDSTAIDTINDILRARADVGSLLKEHFAYIVSFLTLLCKADDDSGTKAPAGTTLQEYRLSAEKGLAWLRTQVGSDLFPELCKRNAEAIIIGCLRLCRDTPTVPYFSFKVVGNAMSYLCEIISVPNFSALFSAHNGDRAYMILVSMYKHLSEASSGQQVELMKAIQGLLTGFLGPSCLKIPIVLDASIRVLCRIIKDFPSLRSLACESFRNIWESVVETKDGLSLLTAHFHVASSYLSSLATESADVGKCYELLTETFTDRAEGMPFLARTESNGNMRPKVDNALRFAEPSQIDTDSLARGKGAKRGREFSQNNPESSEPTAAQALQTISTLTNILSRSATVSTPPASFFLSMAKVVDAQSLFIKTCISEEVWAKETAWVYLGVSNQFVRKEQLAASRRSRLRASAAAQSSNMSVAEEVQKAARNVWMVCNRSEVAIDIRSAALETLRALVGCLIEGCGMEELLQIEFAPSTTGSIESAQFAEGSWSQVDFCSHSIEHNVFHLYCRLLFQVRSLAVDSSPYIMIVASTVLRDICADVVSADSIFSNCLSLMRDAYPEEYAKIKPFRREQAARASRLTKAVGWDALKSDTGLSDLIAAFPLIPSEQLWLLAKTDPDTFLKALTTQLLKTYVLQQHSSLTPLLALTATHTGFAEMYFPLVLLHVSMRKPTDDKERLRKFMATNFDAILRNKDIQPNLVSVILQAINFVRAARNNVILAFGVIDTSYAQAAPSNDDEKRRDKATKELRQEFDKLNKSSIVGHRDRMLSQKDTLWFPVENLPLTTLAAAAAACEEWAMCLMLTEMSFDSLEGTNGLSSVVTFAVGGDTMFGSDVVSTNQHTTRKAARGQMLASAVKGLHETVGPLLLQCASKLRDAGLLRQLLFTHRSIIAGASVSCSSNSVRQLALSLRRERYNLLGNLPVAMQLDEKTTAYNSTSITNAVRAPMRNVSRLHQQASERQFGSTTVAALTQLGCPAAALCIASASLLAEAAAEAAWRSGQWEDFSEVGVSSDAAAIHRSLLSALSHTHARDIAMVNTAVSEGREAIVSSLNAYNVLECCVLAQSLREVSIFSRLPIGSDGLVAVPPQWVTVADNKADAMSGRHQQLQALALSKKRCYQFAVGSPHFGLSEPLEAVRNALGGMGLREEWRANHLSQVARVAASQGSPFTPLNWVHTFIQQCRNAAHVSDSSFAIGRSLLLNAAGDAEAAIQVLADLPASHKSPEALALMGAWSARYQRVPLQKLVREPCMREMAMADTSHTFLFAMWCDALMRGVKESLESKSMQASLQHMQALETAVPANNKDLKKLDLLKKEVEEIDRQRATLKTDLALYADTAFIGLAKSLMAESTGNDLHSIYRIMHHWLGEGAVTITSSAQEQIALIPPVKFLPVFPQLVVRVTSSKQRSNNSSTDDLLRKVVHGCIELFPMHCLWHVFALKQSLDSAKAEAATELLTHAYSIKALVPYVKQVAALVDAYTQQGAIPKDRESNVEGSTLQALVTTAAQCPAIPVPTTPTRHVELNPLTNGGSLSAPNTPEHENGFKSISPTYKVLGGLSRPRLITITMRSGLTTKQIIKSGDDLRQDALIEQVFSLGNTLLALRSGGTGVIAASGIRGDPLSSVGRQAHATLTGWESYSASRLYMRTFIAVPLGADCGLIQFLDTAMSVGDYLAEDTTGAHRRYFPKELSSYQCRAMLQRTARQTITASGKPLLAAFEEVCEGFTPAMHYFYFEHYVSPKQWMEARKRYISTAAVSSIIGYTVGLGDRHATNVMIDKHTAEVVHIDLGISFDQGALLPIPEVVPFRLTRDIVDGMGIFGIEGPFRQICEQTLLTMRENRDLLNAVVETFVFDPLACWNVDIALKDTTNGEGKSTKKQSQVEKSKFAPLKAHAAMSRTSEKLSGHENGEILAVPNQVQMLLRNATDPENLCQLFHGWSAWL